LSKRRSAQEVLATADLARLCGTLALEKKAGHVLLLDLRAFPLNTDCFLIASGRTEPHVRAIADWIVDELARRHGISPWHIEGRTFGRWVLLDYVDWVVHVFHRETREYYLLERLWDDAPREALGGEEDAGEDLPGGGSQEDDALEGEGGEREAMGAAGRGSAKPGPSSPGGGVPDDPDLPADDAWPADDGDLR